jgi:hypothetical protein
MLSLDCRERLFWTRSSSQLRPLCRRYLSLPRLTLARDMRWGLEAWFVWGCGVLGGTVHAVDGGVWLVDIFHGDSVVKPLLLQVGKMSKTIPLCSCLKILSPRAFYIIKLVKHDTYLSIKHQDIIIHTSRRFREDLTINTSSNVTT